MLILVVPMDNHMTGMYTSIDLYLQQRHMPGDLPGVTFFFCNTANFGKWNNHKGDEIRKKFSPPLGCEGYYPLLPNLGKVCFYSGSLAGKTGILLLLPYSRPSHSGFHPSSQVNVNDRCEMRVDPKSGPLSEQLKVQPSLVGCFCCCCCCWTQATYLGT